VPDDIRYMYIVTQFSMFIYRMLQVHRNWEGGWGQGRKEEAASIVYFTPCAALISTDSRS
jgi:hypothetical protein